MKNGSKLTMKWNFIGKWK